MRRVVLLFGEGDPDTTIRAVIGDRDLDAELTAAGGEHELTIIATRAAAGATHSIVVDSRHSRRQRVLEGLGGRRVIRLMRASAPGRLLLSLSPLSPAREFRRALGADRHAIEVLACADVVVAADLAATSAAWHSRRRHPRQRAFWGLDRALRLLSESPRPETGSARG